jgi:hypothetical protein
MVATQTPQEPGVIVRKSVLTFVGLAGSVACLTILYLSMRSVMAVGGTCASGNTPYAIRTPCPTGVPGLMMGSIFLGLAFLSLYALSAVGPNLVFLAWPALFLSLGWNFLDFGLNPPGDSGGGGGWLVCAVVFFLMGGVPLAIGIWAVLNGHESKVRTVDAARVRAVGAKTRSLLTSKSSAGGDADDNKRLDDLRVSGQLSQSEYDAARAAALRKRDS